MIALYNPNALRGVGRLVESIERIPIPGSSRVEQPCCCAPHMHMFQDTCVSFSHPRDLDEG
jgi:hypothetical protein